MKNFFLLEPTKNNLFAALLCLSLVFLFYSSYFSLQNMISEIYTQLGYDYLGNFTILFYCLGASICAIVAPGYIKYISFNNWLFISGIAFLIFQFSAIVTYSCSLSQDSSICDFSFIYLIGCLGGAIAGIGNILNWISLSGYITNICTLDKKALFFSLSIGFFQASTMGSGLISLFSINMSDNQFDFFIVDFLICVFTTIGYLFLVKYPKGNFINDEEKTHIKRIKDILILYKSKLKSRITYISIFVGAEMGFYNCFFYTIMENTFEIVSTKDTNLKTIYVFICLGICEFLGGLFVSTFCNKYKISYFICLGFFCFAITFFFINIILYLDKNYIYCFIIGGTVGFGDCILQSMSSTIIATKENNVENFAHFMSLQFLSNFFSVLFSIYFSSNFYMYYLYFIYVICLLGVCYYK